MAADLPPDERPRCTATSVTTGERCKRRPHPGSNTCVKHGSGAPQVRAAAARRVREGKAVELAGRLRLGVEFSRDGRKVLEDALIVAQSYMAALEADPGAAWPLKLAALERVASIAVACARIQDPATMDGQRASEAARQALGRVAGAVVTVARRAVYAAGGDSEHTSAALRELEADLAKITVPVG
jgi:hypothetical protein